MTLKQAIDKVNAFKPNTLTDDQKTDILTTAEGGVRAIVNKIEGTDSPNLKYRYEKDQNALLTAVSPYDELYVFYLAAMIDYWNGEWDGYQTGMIMYNNLLNEFRRQYKPVKVSEPTRITGLWGGL